MLNLDWFAKIRKRLSMIELFKNIGLGIFVNGAFAWQFGEATTKGLLAIIEGATIMAIAIYLERKANK